MSALSLPTVDRTIKIIVSACLVSLYLLPIELKELYVDKGGHFNGINAFSVFLCIAGLQYNWKYIGEIIMGLNILGVIAGLLFYFTDYRPGFLINICVSLISLCCLWWLKHLYKSEQ